MPPVIQIRVSPTDCDGLGHVGQKQFVALFDRALWEALATVPESTYSRATASGRSCAG